MLTPEQRKLRAQIAANTSWANTPDRSARTEKARRANLDRFEAMVPAAVTDPIQRAKAAENLKRAHYQRMAFKSAQVRRRTTVRLADGKSAPTAGIPKSMSEGDTAAGAA